MTHRMLGSVTLEILHFIKNALRTGEMTQWVKCLLYKHEDLSSDPPSTHIKNQMWQHAPIIPVLGMGSEDPGGLPGQPV